MNREREQRVRLLAHDIWEAEGRPSGQETRHWYMALRLVEAGERNLDGDARAESPLPPSAAGDDEY